MDAAHKLDAMQIENILDKLVPQITEPQNHEFFRGVLGLKFENCSSAEAAILVKKIYDEIMP